MSSDALCVVMWYCVCVRAHAVSLNATGYLVTNHVVIETME